MRSRCKDLWTYLNPQLLCRHPNVFLRTRLLKHKLMELNPQLTYRQPRMFLRTRLPKLSSKYPRPRMY